MPLRRDRLPTPVFLGFTGGSDGKESTCNAGYLSVFDPWAWKISWRREQLPTPIFLLEEFHGQSSLAGYSPWGRKELDTTEQLSLYPHLFIKTSLIEFLLISYSGLI